MAGLIKSANGSAPALRAVGISIRVGCPACGGSGRSGAVIRDATAQHHTFCTSCGGQGHVAGMVPLEQLGEFFCRPEVMAAVRALGEKLNAQAVQEGGGNGNGQAPV